MSLPRTSRSFGTWNCSHNYLAKTGQVFFCNASMVLWRGYLVSDLHSRLNSTCRIWPKTRLWVCLLEINRLRSWCNINQDWFRLLSDPDPPELERMIRIGEAVTWPKVKTLSARRAVVLTSFRVVAAHDRKSSQNREENITRSTSCS